MPTYGKIGINAPKRVTCLNVDLFIDLLSSISGDFSYTPDEVFKKWDVLRYIYLDDSYEVIKKSMLELADISALPAEIVKYIGDEIEDLSIEQRFDLMFSLVEFDEVMSPILDFVDKDKLRFYVGDFESYKNGNRDPFVLASISGLYRNIYEEAYSFSVAMSSMAPKRDLIIKIFSTQNIRYATGELNFDKIFKILKSQFGDVYNHYAVYKGLLIDRFLSAGRASGNIKQSSAEIGLSLEKAVLDLYSLIGYTVSETSASGDFGIDVIAQSNTEKIGIQCKNYAGNVGVESVMQAHSGGHYYGCSRFIVYSANGFTAAALEMANKLKVELLVYRGEIE